MKNYFDQIKVKELKEEVLLRQLSTAYGSAAETGNDILERLLDPFLDSISGIVERKVYFYVTYLIVFSSFIYRGTP